VQLVDGKTGWVDKRFLSNDKPAKVRLLMLQSKYRQLQEKLDTVNKELETVGQLANARKPAQMGPFEKPSKTIVRLKNQAIQIRLQPAAKLEQVGKGAELTRSADEPRVATSWLYLIFLLAVGGAVGVYVGLKIQERRQLNERGGVRA
jgi:hypothetical protein